MLPLLLALALAAPPAGPHRPKLAVLDIQDVTGGDAAKARLLTQVVFSEVAATGRFDTISSAEIIQMLGLERQRQLLGCAEGSSCLAEIGGALGADYLVSGQLGKLGTRYRLDLRLIDARRAKVLASQGGFVVGSDDALGDTTVAMVRKLLSDAGLVEPAAAGGLQASVGAAPPSRTPAYAALGASAALAVGAGILTVLTRSTYQSAVAEHERAPGAPSASGARLGWMGPLTDGLWAGAAVAGGVGAYLWFSSSPSAGAGGELGMGGHF